MGFWFQDDEKAKKVEKDKEKDGKPSAKGKKGDNKDTNNCPSQRLKVLSFLHFCGMSS